MNNSSEIDGELLCKVNALSSTSSSASPAAFVAPRVDWDVARRSNDGSDVLVAGNSPSGSVAVVDFRVGSVAAADVDALGRLPQV